MVDKPSWLESWTWVDVRPWYVKLYYKIKFLFVKDKRKAGFFTEVYTDDPTTTQEIRYDPSTHLDFLEGHTYKMSDWILTGIGGFFYWSNTKTKVNKPYKGDIEPDKILEVLPDDLLEEVLKDFFERKGR